jgi:hypothetical protein
MGTHDHPIGEVGVKVNDNVYHVVRFTRSGANSTIQVDDYNVQTNHPAGKNFRTHVDKISRMTHTMAFSGMMFLPSFVKMYWFNNY